MQLVKESIKGLKAYSANQGSFRIKLDANEGKNILFKDITSEGLKFEEDFYINYYPDNDAVRLREELGNYVGVNPRNILVGNGSSELIELVIKTYVDKGEVIMGFLPSFSMYQIFSQIHSARFIGVESNEDFTVDIDLLIKRAKQMNPKLILICNPNNPTGHLIEQKDVKKLLEETDSIVVVDEAYMEFAEGSMVQEVSKYRNLIVLRTLSKALGLAAIRLGYMIACEDIIKVINCVRAPYNLNAITQYVGVLALKNKDRIYDYVEEVKRERAFLYDELRKLPFTVYKSYGNFILIKSDIEDLGEKLAAQGILIRSFSGDMRQYYRIAVGNRSENQELLKSLKEIVKDEKV
ncbi:histidinol-phosphate transaminase [Lutispora thermophila]|uniref:Histidinol-phosphate aminotransferase n=1 Tax=Lutispora thermophila DSM 19022 TaxID=1122184 RepID=A0A1M6FGY5_9FIRM|nr:histidinol-phosphate transaminase [Lutispora thermophila]SHI96926.1 histidinol-phosphate aminotransferase [Lutispora thermophila DSM 19022]